MMRLALCILLCRVAQAQNSGSVSGTVIDSVTGAPIRKARVTISNAQYPAVTDASGSFQFDRVPPGYKVLIGQHPDYPPRRTTSYGKADFTLSPGEQKRGLQIRLTPAASVSGQILDADGDPLPDCNVFLFDAGPAIDSATDQNGDYVLTHVPAGRYYLEARCRGSNLQAREFAPPQAHLRTHRLGYGFRFYPEADRFSSAQKIEVAPGQSLRGFNFRMAPETVSDVAIHVTGSSARVFASLMPDDNGPQSQYEARVGQDRIESVPPGNYILRVISTGSGMQLLARQPVQIGENTTELTVLLTPPISLSGTVIAKGLESQPTRIWLNHITEPGLEFQSDIKPDNTFAFSAVSPGRYRVTTTAGPWVQSVSVGGEFSDGAEFDLKPGAKGPLEIRMSNARGTVSGDVETGPAKPARIMIIMSFFSFGSSRVETELGEPTGQPPRFSFQFPPGKYRIYAIEYVPGRPAFTLGDNDTLSALGELVEIRANSETVKNLKLITAEEFAKADQ